MTRHGNSVVHRVEQLQYNGIRSGGPCCRDDNHVLYTIFYGLLGTFRDTSKVDGIVIGAFAPG
eukprot:scaffold12976_cov197-Amphora_coffeaeformis.AAC.8